MNAEKVYILVSVNHINYITPILYNLVCLLQQRLKAVIGPPIPLLSWMYAVI